MKQFASQWPKRDPHLFFITIIIIIILMIILCNLNSSNENCWRPSERLVRLCSSGLLASTVLGLASSSSRISSLSNPLSINLLSLAYTWLILTILSAHIKRYVTTTLWSTATPSCKLNLLFQNHPLFIARDECLTFTFKCVYGLFIISVLDQYLLFTFWTVFDIRH